ncbi:hypothetical protein VHEMI04803 [[Torrubiella] hemipterigena]|uniref:BRCT domain-containing protein n=1 Tax=[Torrubiella] hemipterigena TaxID=1531966 RepID=A0A0A1TH58_9HYPO|nr:hypothetical protein VHEMI04803 [[Torrubiella] hemipterigena]
MDSPPKRITRARAAAKSGDSGVKIITAAAKAKLIGATPIHTSSGTKRKTRSDDTDDEDESSKRASNIKRHRGRVGIDADDTEVKAAPRRLPRRLASEPKTTAPTKKTAPAQRTTTRTRSSTVTRTTAAAAAKTVPPKKAVKFDALDKENIEPSKKVKENDAIGLRARGPKKATETKKKTTADSTKSAETDKVKPLSPKKVTQMPMSRDGEEAKDMPSSIPVAKSPARGHPAGISKKSEQDNAERDVDSTITINAAILDNHELTSGLGSPARRPIASPTRENTLRSPAKKIGGISFPPSSMKPFSKSATDSSGENTLAFKSSLWQTPAKRPPSPIKGMNLTTIQTKNGAQHTAKLSMFQSPAKKGMPGLKPLTSNQLCDTPAMKPMMVDSRRPSEKLIEEDESDVSTEDLANIIRTAPIGMPKFTSQPSCVVPRDIDPTFEEEAEPVEEDDSIELIDTSGLVDDEVVVDKPTLVDPQTPEQRTQFTFTPSAQSTTFESNLASTSNTKPRFNRRETLGLGSFGNDLTNFDATNPLKVEATPAAPRLQWPQSAAKGASPMKTTFFDDEMNVREDEDEVQAAEDNAVLEPEFDEIAMTAEDVALTREADRLSFGGGDIHGAASSFDDNASEASQEYGNENDIPVDPAMLPPVTPGRTVSTIYADTTTKVPLKDADTSTPGFKGKRSFSASSIPSNGTGSLPKSATVISYSPTKESNDMWSTAGTPAQTPRKEITSSLLRGAVVFVDVHTSEGADASGIFVDLLQQMGAKCVKTWNWNPNDSSSSRIGITHVVFKDGGKKTMERIRKAKGVVQCVGVSWVLDCERENEWLDEGPYLVDSSFVPRGGARRRKSMEPQALANLNGSVVKTPSKASSKDNATTTPYNRRQSAIWVHTPSDQGDVEDAEGDEDDVEWSKFILTPAPKTPAPAAVSKYASEIPMTPSFADDSEQLSPSKVETLLRTCPSTTLPIRTVGEGMLSPEKDEQVRLRLMAARRKSLQFAPKIGSPLARTWQ